MIDPLISEAPVVATDRTLRQFAGLWVLFFGGLAVWQWLGSAHPAPALLLGGLAVGVGLPGLVWPRFTRPVFTGMTTVAYPLGWLVTQVVLALIYYGLFTAVALLFRLIRRDALQRRLDPSAATYWQPRETPADPGRYFQQF